MYLAINIFFFLIQCIFILLEQRHLNNGEREKRKRVNGIYFLEYLNSASCPKVFHVQTCFHLSKPKNREI